METFNYTITLTVSVEAFDAGDAWSAVQDAFGVGEDLGIKITTCEFEEDE